MKPGSKDPGIELRDGTIVMRVRERAVEGRANAACIAALADRIGIAPSRIALLHGARSRKKVFEVDGISSEAVYEGLGTPKAG